MKTILPRQHGCTAPSPVVRKLKSAPSPVVRKLKSALKATPEYQAASIDAAKLPHADIFLHETAPDSRHHPQLLIVTR